MGATVATQSSTSCCFRRRLSRQLNQHALKKQLAALDRGRAVPQRITFEDLELLHRGARAELLPRQIDVRGRIARRIDVPEMGLQSRTRIDLARGDLEAREEPLDDTRGRIALAQCRVTGLEDAEIGGAAIPTRLQRPSQPPKRYGTPCSTGAREVSGAEGKADRHSF